MNNDPDGHCPICIGAAVGAVAGAALYIFSEIQQPEGFDFKEDWKDLAVAATSGAVAGALITIPGAGAIGVSMAASLATDHAINVATGRNFSGSRNIEAGAVGALVGYTTGAIAGAGLEVADTILAQSLSAMSVVAGWKMLKHNFDGYKYTGSDIVEVASAGVAQGLGSSLSHGKEALDAAIIEGVTSYGAGMMMASGSTTQKSSSVLAKPRIILTGKGHTRRGHYEE